MDAWSIVKIVWFAVLIFIGIFIIIGIINAIIDEFVVKIKVRKTINVLLEEIQKEEVESKKEDK